VLPVKCKSRQIKKQQRERERDCLVKEPKILTQHQKLHDIVFPGRQHHLVLQRQWMFGVTSLTTENRIA
jgi:hypothetical protein